MKDKAMRIRDDFSFHVEVASRLPANASLVVAGAKNIYLHHGKLYIPSGRRWLVFHLRDLMDVIPNYRKNSLNLEFEDYSLEVKSSERGNITLLRDLFQLVQGLQWEVS